ncbi:MAG: helix-turn-helix domain-containing protein [Sporomusaceae bacterium]|nr:helix-turn-helix domain-containing protein [Sporomusaceae bacterium]
MEKYYTPNEAAELFSLKEKTLKDWLRAGKIRGEKVGRSWRIADSVLREFLKLPMEMNDDLITKSLVLEELTKLQSNLLDVYTETRKGMTSSEALHLASVLEEAIQSIIGQKDYLNEEPGTQKRPRRIQIEQEEPGTQKHPRGGGDVEQDSLVDDIHNTIEELVRGNYFLYLEEWTDGYDLTGEKIVERIEDHLKNVLKIRTNSSVLRNIFKDLSASLDECSEKTNQRPQSILTRVEAYKLAAHFKSLEDYIKNNL